MFDITFTGQATSNSAFGRTPTRPELTKLAERMGHRVRSSVTSHTNLLVSSYASAKEGSNKWQAAQEHGVRVVSYDEFYSIVAQAAADA